MNLGERIKKIREQKGIKQYELAKKAEISVNALINYEKNKRNPPLRAVDKIALALDVTPFYLMYGENEPMLSITNVVKEFNNSTELINQKIDMLLKAFDINNIKYDQIKKLRNFVNSSEAFLVCISAFDTTGGKTTDKMLFNRDKQDNDRYCCKQ